MEIALKLIVIDFDALCSTFMYRRISGDTGAMTWTTFVAILLGIYCDEIVSSLRFLNSPRNKTHPRHQDDSVAQTYRRASVNTSSLDGNYSLMLQLFALVIRPYVRKLPHRLRTKRNSTNITSIRFSSYC